MFSFLSKTKKKSASADAKELRKEVASLRKEVAELSQELNAFQKKMRKAVTKVALLRYNPFKNIGSDQSFSVALLDEEKDGVVLSSHYLKELNRVYAKHVRKGKSSHSLSEEEEQVLKEAQEQ